jgi:hypothetical protein
MAKAFTVKDMYNFVNLNDAKLKKNRVMVCILLSILIESTLYHINNKIYKSRLMRSTKAEDYKSFPPCATAFSFARWFSSILRILLDVWRSHLIYTNDELQCQTIQLDNSASLVDRILEIAKVSNKAWRY